MAKNLTVSLPQQYADRLATEARITGLNASEIIRRALDEYLDGRAITRRGGGYK